MIGRLGADFAEKGTRRKLDVGKMGDCVVDWGSAVAGGDQPNDNGQSVVDVKKITGFKTYLDVMPVHMYVPSLS